MAKKVILKKSFLSGNEALARGAWESGLSVACAYPGTPSTEILEAMAGWVQGIGCPMVRERKSGL
ncbi:MAG: hypothetical protein ACYSQY_08205 [Planctomycetota bacterium]|jgi:indolepyruvate ferredoxin oxidoreductase alpha subunit